ncbi:hypothetical protein BSL78_00015 [Apostichopus japonicus]|uniref:SBF1/SBF2 domain-containing protein n=1 Tax=Stichopus japonicus TaxID=307972 RepID=A0A2G8LRW1_STIJA|nr:hypothetical protein BSL78_00015 [Apostichopus japonicus]
MKQVQIRTTGSVSVLLKWTRAAGHTSAKECAIRSARCLWELGENISPQILLQAGTREEASLAYQSHKLTETLSTLLLPILFLFSDKIDQETSATFDSYCKYSAGRRHFAELLNQRRIRDKLVEENTFYRLVQFFAICLFECHEAEDFTPATTLMNMCFTFYHNDATGGLSNNGTNDEDKSLSFLYTHLKDQHIWKSMRFWDVAFLTAMHQERTRWKHQQSPPVFSPLDVKEMDEMEENTTFGQLGTILHNMRELKIPKDVCLKFLEKTSAIGNLKQDHFESLLAIVDQIEGSSESQERKSSSGSKVGNCSRMC